MKRMTQHPAAGQGGGSAGEGLALQASGPVSDPRAHVETALVMLTCDPGIRRVDRRLPELTGYPVGELQASERPCLKGR